jgi:hypothetical protein
MSDIELKNAFIDLRAQKKSLKKISKRLNKNVETLKVWEGSSHATIYRRRVQFVKNEERVSLGILLKKDIESCDKILKSIEKQIKKRGLQNVSTTDLLRYFSETQKIKSQKSEIFSKNNI